MRRARVLYVHVYALYLDLTSRITNLREVYGMISVLECVYSRGCTLYIVHTFYFIQSNREFTFVFTFEKIH